MPRLSHRFRVILFVLAITAACSTQKTVTTRTVQYDPRTNEPVMVQQETTTTTEKSADRSSILSGTVSVLGDVISVPFRIVGFLIRTIL
jgi:type IV pilus biogenesis protein CpaD/CtpE